MPPNEPATPGTDRICAACGAPQHEKLCIKLRATRVIEPLCLACFQSGSADDTERLILERRKSAPTPQFVPAVGEMCEGIPCKNSRFGGTGVQGGKFKHFDETNGEKQAMLELEGGVHCLVLRSSLKPAPAPVYFGTMPSELPVEIPAGTPIAWDGKLVAAGTIRLVNGYYVGPSEDKSTGFVSSPEAHYEPNTLDWSRIPKPSPKAVPAPHFWTCRECKAFVSRVGSTATCEADFVCGSCAVKPEPGQSPPDPYAGYDLNAWGQPAVREPVTVRCSDCGAQCSVIDIDSGHSDVCVYCAHRWQGVEPSDDPTKASRISAARHSTEREAGVKRFDAWVSTRWARKP